MAAGFEHSGRWCVSERAVLLPSDLVWKGDENWQGLWVCQQLALYGSGETQKEECEELLWAELCLHH